MTSRISPELLHGQRDERLLLFRSSNDSIAKAEHREYRTRMSDNAALKDMQTPNEHRARHATRIGPIVLQGNRSSFDRYPNASFDEKREEDRLLLIRKQWRASFASLTSSFLRLFW